MLPNLVDTRCSAIGNFLYVISFRYYGHQKSVRRLKFLLETLETDMLEIFAYRTVTVGYFPDQTWISKTVHCIRYVMVCKIGFTKWNAKIALLRASMVVNNYIKLFPTRTDRNNGILMSLLLLVTEAIKCLRYCSCYNMCLEFLFINELFWCCDSLRVSFLRNQLREKQNLLS